MTWRIQKLFTVAAIAAALLINSLPAKPAEGLAPAKPAPTAPERQKKAASPSDCLGGFIELLISRSAA